MTDASNCGIIAALEQALAGMRSEFQRDADGTALWFHALTSSGVYASRRCRCPPRPGGAGSNGACWR